MEAADLHDAITATWKAEAARLIAALVRITRDLALAEDLAQDALVAALEQWPGSGLPENPGAWLMTIAKRRAVDHFRRAERLRAKNAELGSALQRQEETAMPDLGASIDHIEDDVLRLMFVTSHPALTVDSQVALTLRLLGGLTAREIARSFLVPESTVAQRISRAKRTLAEGGIAFDVPAEDERPARLESVLRVVYLVFTEGYAATAGDDWMRPALCAEALHLGGLLADLAPGAPEVHGLLALMRLQSSRSTARTGPGGEPVLLRDQDRARWDQLLIRRGLTSLDRAVALGEPYGPYTLQAAIAACHARASSVEATDWGHIAALYDALALAMPSPVVSLNRAVARRTCRAAPRRPGRGPRAQRQQRRGARSHAAGSAGGTNVPRSACRWPRTSRPAESSKCSSWCTASSGRPIISCGNRRCSWTRCARSRSCVSASTGVIDPSCSIAITATPSVNSSPMESTSPPR